MLVGDAFRHVLPVGHIHPLHRLFLLVLHCLYGDAVGYQLHLLNIAGKSVILEEFIVLNWVMFQASSEVLGACLVTQPRKLADKKSSFLRALRRESSEPNAETAPTSRVSPPPTVTPENTDKQVIKH